MLCDRDNCTGCGACVAKCGKGALHMQYSSEGFLQPVLEESACTHCGLCEKTCPVLNESVPLKKKAPRAYVAKYRDPEILAQSASGGLFTALALEIIRKDGVVFGAAWRKDHTVQHGYAESERELSAFRGSKYAQSNAAETYPQVKAALESGRAVLFTGVPCQIAGLYGYLGQDYPELYTVDLVCHGGGSPKMLCEHLRELERTKAAEIKEISHTYKRSDKFDPMIPKTTHILYSDGTEEYFGSREDVYIDLFLSGSIYRKGCYSCPFSRVPRVADITIGDFKGFGSHKRYPFDTAGGISQVLVNTDKGMSLFDRAQSRENVSALPVDLWDCLIFNHNIWKPSAEPSKRDELYRGYEKDGLTAVRQYHAAQNSGWQRSFRKVVKAILGPHGMILVLYWLNSFLYGKRVKNIITRLDEL